jgi:hypothetical protein
MKQTAIVVIALLCLTTAQAQKKGNGIEVGLGLDGDLPVGNYLEPYTSAGVGGDATIGYNFNTHSALLMRAGFMSFFAKNEYSDETNINSITDAFIKLVGRYTFTNRFYLEPQLGYSNFTSPSGGANKINENSFTYAAAAGIFLNKQKSFDVSVRYEGNTGSKAVNFVGLRIAYSLKPGMYF